MGITCACQKIETEEETINRIMRSLALADIDSTQAYEEFIKCINVKNELDYFLFHNYLVKIVGENNYQNIQTNYFKNLSKIQIENSNIKKIGLMIITLSRSSDLIKNELLVRHFFKFYYIENNLLANNKNSQIDSSTLVFYIKDFISDFIDCNTYHCLSVFQHFMDSEEIRIINEIWQTKRKKKLFSSILSNIEELKLKFVIDSTNTHLDDDKNKIDFSQYSSHNKIDLNNLDSLKNDLIPYPDDNKNFKKMNSAGELIIDRKYKDSVYDTKIINEFIELSYPQFSGEFMRNYLYDEYMKEKTYDRVCY